MFDAAVSALGLSSLSGAAVSSNAGNLKRGNGGRRVDRVEDSGSPSLGLAGAAMLMLSLALLFPARIARADCFEWDESQAEIRSGILHGLATGPLRWRIGSVAADHGRRQSAVELRWSQPGGRMAAQGLFQGIHDGQAALSRRNGRLELRISYCDSSRDVCRPVVLPFTWDRSTRRFAGASAVAATALSSTCAAAVDEPSER